jgi:hypothetical protein
MSIAWEFSVLKNTGAVFIFAAIARVAIRIDAVGAKITH